MLYASSKRPNSSCAVAAEVRKAQTNALFWSIVEDHAHVTAVQDGSRTGGERGWTDSHRWLVSCWICVGDRSSLSRLVWPRIVWLVRVIDGNLQ